MWRKMSYSGILMLLALGIAGQSLDGQVGPGPGGDRGLRGPAGPHLGHSVSVALENSEGLELTGDQTAQLQELKALLDGDIQELVAEMKTLREEIQSGQVARDEGHRQMVALRGELMTASAPLRGRVQEILTVQQHNTLQELVWESRPGPGRAGPFMGPQRTPRRGRGIGPVHGGMRDPGALGRPRGMPGRPRGGGIQGS